MPSMLSFADAIHDFLYQLPIGAMTPNQDKFGCRAIETLKQRKSIETCRQAELILQRLETERIELGKNRNNKQQRSSSNQEDPPPLPPLRMITYQYMLKAWARTPGMDPQIKVTKAKQLLDRLTLYHGQYPEYFPSPHHHNTAVNLYLDFLYVCIQASKEHPGNSALASSEAWALIDRLETEAFIAQQQQPPPPQPRQPHLEKNRNPNPEETMYPPPPQPQPQPLRLTRAFYEALIHIYAYQAAEVYGTAAAAEDVLLHLSEKSTGMVRNHHHNHTKTNAAPLPPNDEDKDAAIAFQPETSTFNRVLLAWSLSPEPSGADRAHAILKMQCSLGPPASPDAVSFGTVIHAYSQRLLPAHAEQVLHRCIQYFNGTKATKTLNNNNATNRVDLTGCFESVAGAWAKKSRSGSSGGVDDDKDPGRTAVEHIQDLLSIATGRRSNKKHALYLPFFVKETFLMHACLVQALVHNGQVHKAQEHIEKMVCKYTAAAKGFLPPVPTIDMAHTVMRGWKIISDQDASQAKEAALRAYHLLQDMFKVERESPTESATFYIVIKLLCQAVQAVSSDSSSSSSSSAAAAAATEDSLPMTCLVKTLQEAEHRRFSTALMYRLAIDALCCQNKSQTSVYHSVTVIRRYKIQADVDHKLEWIPIRVIGLYTRVISALATLRNDEAAELALALFIELACDGNRRTLALQPTIRTFTSVVQAFSAMGNARSSHVIADIFAQLQRLNKATNNPLNKSVMDAVVFNVLMEATIHDAKLCCEILSYRVKLHQLGRTDLKPDARCKAAIAKALVGCGHFDTAFVVQSLLSGDTSTIPELSTGVQ